MTGLWRGWAAGLRWLVALGAALSGAVLSGALVLGAAAGTARGEEVARTGHPLMAVGVWELRLFPLEDGVSYACGARAGDLSASFWLWIYGDGLVEMGFANEAWPQEAAEDGPPLHLWLQFDQNEPWEIEEAWLGGGEIGFAADSVESAVTFMAELSEAQVITLSDDAEREIARHALVGAPAAVEGVLACVASLVKTLEEPSLPAPMHP